MNDGLRLDAAALELLVNRQNAVAAALEGSAHRLAAGHDWARTPTQREAAAALRGRLELIAQRLTACGAGVDELAARVGAHMAAVAEADRTAVGGVDRTVPR
ncbi:hypothetical protein C6V83_06445 [Gordonia iterans]|uniref:Uncharacterized protein n=1 Tax=Gordonia iterans TaxID=1004901 RepID=A0A2S0KE87_9ACTN|nr:hypothetical protein [Gordonia iterans]AVL99963.1 hypothetical protein C6V83_06445 [Gordonia iterans]